MYLLNNKWNYPVGQIWPWARVWHLCTKINQELASWLGSKERNCPDISLRSIRIHKIDRLKISVLISTTKRQRIRISQNLPATCVLMFTMNPSRSTKIYLGPQGSIRIHQNPSWFGISIAQCWTQTQENVRRDDSEKCLGLLEASGSSSLAD